MINVDIPGFGLARLTDVVFDFNGTLAVEGKLISGVREKLIELSEHLNIHVVTADTFGLAAAQLTGIPCKLKILSPGNEALQKKEYIKKLGEEQTAAFGNGNNDSKMLETARISVAVIESEGCSVKSIRAADIVVSSVLNGLDLFLNQQRLKATLRF